MPVPELTTAEYDALSGAEYDAYLAARRQKNDAEIALLRQIQGTLANMDGEQEEGKRRRGRRPKSTTGHEQWRQYAISPWAWKTKERGRKERAIQARAPGRVPRRGAAGACLASRPPRTSMWCMQSGYS